MATLLCGAKCRTGKTCTHQAGWATDHPGVGYCKFHGGATSNGRKFAVSTALVVPDAPPVTDPLGELAKLAGQALAWRDAIGQKVNDLLDVRYTDANGGEQLRAEVALFERAIDRCNTILTSMARLNIDDRMVKISERQAQMIETAVAAALVVAGLNAAQANLFQRSLNAQLRELV